MNARRLIMVAYLCFTSLSAHAQKNPPPCPGTVWTNRVQRTVYLDTTIKHTMADTTLAEVLTKLVLNKNLTPYSTIDNRFTTKLSSEQILEKISSHADNANQQEDPVTGSTNTRVVMHEFNYNTIRAYRLVEEWQYNVDEGKIDIQILGIAPVVDVYGDEGNYRGSVGMYWLKYEDAKDAIAQFNTQHPKDNLNKLIWRSYCNGDAVPFNNGNIQTGVTSRTVVMPDTTDYYYHRKLVLYNDRLLSQSLIDGARSGGIRIYDTNTRSYLIPLNKLVVDTTTYVKPDSIDLDTETGIRSWKVIIREFKYEWVTNYQLQQEVVFNTSTGAISLLLKGITPKRDYYDDAENFIGRKSMFSFKYADIKNIINRYTMQHPLCNLPLELWRGYFTERE
ncbi:hypothetical protein CJD36_005075 [Flavipsychrobacter stenotrophus]|uniref:Uncharacterized protein n=1 Tax=Flavipsychrobacter stenotrophus TaxID=2077091 RepID=A0A2S7T2P0_9BACT|nr:hypothetical protein [Flavipsychrobacter stenotrophus]PQJ13117.1 hypothetical protein CJD36_005075 [Flavipsychrobacter stenotrophus]